MATEGDTSVSCLCSHFEAVFQHGLRKIALNSSTNSLVLGSVPVGGGGGAVTGASGGATIMFVSLRNHCLFLLHLALLIK